MIDIGSHSLLLLVASEPLSDPQILEEDCHITALGAGMSQSGIIDRSAAERSLEVLQAFIHRCQALGIDKPLLVATGALREAGNQKDMLSFLSMQARFSIRILTEREEAMLTRKGALSGLEVGDHSVTVDLGGRSIELTGPRLSASLPIGCQRASETFLSSDPPETDEIERLRVAVKKLLRTIKPADMEGDATRPPCHPAQVRVASPPVYGELSPSIRPYGASRSIRSEKLSDLVCSGGTATTLAALDQRLTSYQASLIHGHRMTRYRLEELVGKLLPESLAKRSVSWNLEPGRASVLPAGAVILDEICLWHGGKEIVISARGLTWGAWMAWDQLTKPPG